MRSSVYSKNETLPRVGSTQCNHARILTNDTCMLSLGPTCMRSIQSWSRMIIRPLGRCPVWQLRESLAALPMDFHPVTHRVELPTQRITTILFLGHLFQCLAPSKVTIPLARRPAAHLGCQSTNRVTLSDRPRDRLVSQLVLWGINLRPSHRDPSHMQIYFLPFRSHNSSALQAFTMRASTIIALALCAFAGTAMAQSFPHCSSSALQIVNQKLTLCTGALTSNSTSCDTTCRVVLAEVRG